MQKINRILAVLVILALFAGCSFSPESAQPVGITDAFDPPNNTDIMPVESEPASISEALTQSENMPSNNATKEDPEPEIQMPLAEGDTFTVYFLDVGQADAAVIQCCGEAMMIDGGNTEDSSYLYSFLSSHDISLKYVVCTHAHEDHVGGLAAALNYGPVSEQIFCSVKDNASKCFASFTKYVTKQGKEITIPQPGDSYRLGKSQFTFLGPIQKDEEETNNESLVVRFTFGNRAFLFAGDAEDAEEHDIINTGASLKSDVLKVGHHGSNSSSGYIWLREIEPDYAVISVGANNTYGHPAEETLSRLRDADVTVYRTDQCGTVTCVCDGDNIVFSTEREPEAMQMEKPQASSSVAISEPSDYVINISSGKFHYPDCASVGDMKEANRLFTTATRDEILSQGYTPCKRCNP